MIRIKIAGKIFPAVFVTFCPWGSLMVKGGETVRDFDEIYREYGKVVYYYLLSLSRDEALSEELTQETMFRAIMNIGSFRGECKMTTWLCQIAKNLWLEHQKKSHRTVPLEETALFAESDMTVALEERDTAGQILRHLHELEEPYKEVFLLHALSDIPLKEISKLFGKSESWARVTYYRARAMITARLKEGTK